MPADAVLGEDIHLTVSFIHFKEYIQVRFYLEIGPK
jgi:hypothetical protein